MSRALGVGLALAGLLAAGCGVVHDMRAEYVANRALIDARGEAERARPRRDVILSYLDSAYRLRKADSRFVARLVGPYVLIGAWDRALACLTASPHPQSIDNRLLIGQCRLKVGELDRGEAVLLDVLDEARRNVGPGTNREAYAAVLNGVGYCLVDADLRVDEATELIEEALTLDPYNAEIMDSLGWAYYRRGNYKTAAFHIERAARLLLPSGPVGLTRAQAAVDPEILWHLGAVHARLHQSARAERELEQALRLNSANDEARRVLHALQRELPPPATV